MVRGALRLTGPARNLARSVFTTTPVSVADFHTAFDFRLTSAHADGFAFVLQGVGPTARGLSGEGLGYAGIAKSVAVTFDLFDNAGEGANSTGLYLNGVMPSGAGSADLTPSGIDLHVGPRDARGHRLRGRDADGDAEGHGHRGDGDADATWWTSSGRWAGRRTSGSPAARGARRRCRRS